MVHPQEAHPDLHRCLSGPAGHSQDFLSPPHLAYSLQPAQPLYIALLLVDHVSESFLIGTLVIWYLSA